MEINSRDYRIEKPVGTNDVWVYRGRTRMMHLISSSEETEQELARSVKEIIRILDL